jgi:hypothetical protein
LARRYDVVDLDEARARSAGEGGPAGVVITFDDGYRDNFDHALPVLKRHGATGTFYVVAGNIWPEAPIWTVRLRHVLGDFRASDVRAGAVRLDLAGPKPANGRCALTRWLRGVDAEKARAASGQVSWLDRTKSSTPAS